MLHLALFSIKILYIEKLRISHSKNVLKFHMQADADVLQHKVYKSSYWIALLFYTSCYPLTSCLGDKERFQIWTTLRPKEMPLEKTNDVHREARGEGWKPIELALH